MGVKINTTELLNILELTPVHHNIMLVGKHGIGKSRIVEEYFTERGRRVVTLFLGQMSDPGDIIGLPVLNATTNKTDFCPPYWFPAKDEPIVLFLDELNRARPEILQTVMDLTLNKMLAGKKLPEGSQIISAVNEGEEYQLTDLDPALLSRFNVYFFAPTPAEWLLWAAKNQLDERVIEFIDNNRDCLESAIYQDAGMDKTADRRSWQRVSELIANVEKVDKTLEKAIAGIIGIAVALKFVTFLKSKSGMDVKQVLTDFAKHRKRLESMPIHELTPLNESMFRTIETEEKPDVLKSYIENLELYTKWLRRGERNEVLAHWTTLYESATYPKTKVAILTHSPYIFKNMVDFIKDIKL
jgi:MoxR-like ATPase